MLGMLGIPELTVVVAMVAILNLAKLCTNPRVSQTEIRSCGRLLLVCVGGAAIVHIFVLVLNSWFR
jgi:hypothetical protein